VFCQAQNASKPVFGRGSALDPAGGAYDAPPDPLVGWGGGYPLPIPLPLDAFGVSISVSAPAAPRLLAPRNKFLATPLYRDQPIIRLGPRPTTSEIRP